ncbi:MAG TPA: hypothetical protein VGX27_00985 [Candidatus Dormibacteraeota bacterium]|nr:hypothetical protein [Candidatus Dormibacteraeota bacterium]
MNWLMVGAAAVLAIAIVAGLMAGRLSGLRPIPANHGRASERCASRPTDLSNRFARVHGCITFSDGTQIVAVDPYHPANNSVLGPSNGQLPITWSRDGRRLLLGSTRDLYVMNADGSEVQLTHGDAGVSQGGSFSPDGTEVVYVGYRPSTYGLYVVEVTGRAPRLIAASTSCSTLGPCSGDFLAYPAWSPDGSRIAYADYYQGPTSNSGTDEIWTVKSDGTDKRQLLDLGRCGPNQASGCTNGLAWSPDGSQLAFHSAGGIYIVHADGSGLHRISKDGGQPSWSPDGSRIAFTRGGELFTMATDGGDMTLLKGVVPVPNYAWAWNPAG